MPKSKNSPSHEKKKRRFKPGTVASRKVKKFEKGTDSILAWAPIRRLLRSYPSSICKRFNLPEKIGWRISDGAVDLVRSAVEHLAVCLFQACSQLLKLKEKLTLSRKDLEYIIKHGACLVDPRVLHGLPLDYEGDNIIKEGTTVTNSAIQKLSYRGGIVRMKKDVYLPMKALLVGLMWRIMVDAVIAASNMKMKTIQKKHVLFAFKNLGINMIGGSEGVRMPHLHSKAQRVKKDQSNLVEDDSAGESGPSEV